MQLGAKKMPKAKLLPDENKKPSKRRVPEKYDEFCEIGKTEGDAEVCEKDKSAGLVRIKRAVQK